MKNILSGLLLFAALAVAAISAEIRVATLNCYLLFSPGIDHAGKLDDEHPLSPEAYRTKLSNLARLMNGCDVVGLQETGGRKEVTDLAAVLGYDWAFAKGRDTKTGEEVGLVYRPLPGWHYSVDGRVGALEKVLSKHLLVTATLGKQRVRFLVVHLLRPFGVNLPKQAAQVAAVNRWAEEQAQVPGTTVVVLGDTNSADTSPIFTFGTEVNQLLGYQGTHLTGKPFDRMAASPNAHWSKATVVAPPYGRRPNDLLKQLWTDHSLLSAALDF